MSNEFRNQFVERAPSTYQEQFCRHSSSPPPSSLTQLYLLSPYIFLTLETSPSLSLSLHVSIYLYFFLSLYLLLLPCTLYNIYLTSRFSSVGSIFFLTFLLSYSPYCTFFYNMSLQHSLLSIAFLISSCPYLYLSLFHNI